VSKRVVEHYDVVAVDAGQLRRALASVPDDATFVDTDYVDARFISESTPTNFKFERVVGYER
jgi:hypothetical protein